MKDIFRKTALDKISSPDQLDQVIEITPPGFRIAMIGAGFMLLTVFIWSVFGRIPVNINADGVCIISGGVRTVYSESTGIIDEVLVKEGDKVEKGDVIATFFDDTGKEPAGIKTVTDGYVTGINIVPGSAVNAGSPVCRITGKDQTGDDPMSVILYVPVSDGKTIREGMEVRVYPSTVNRQEYGHINGVVSKVDDYVTSTEKIQNMLGNDTLVQSFLDEGPVIQIQCSLDRDSSTVSGYEWSNKKGASVELSPGTIVNADIVTQEKAPITMLLPMFQDKSVSGNRTIQVGENR